MGNIKKTPIFNGILLTIELRDRAVSSRELSAVLGWMSSSAGFMVSTIYAKPFLSPPPHTLAKGPRW